ncbi:hypothetical protein pb186bvf_016636 [Paramecium bursaria]
MSSFIKYCYILYGGLFQWAFSLKGSISLNQYFGQFIYQAFNVFIVNFWITILKIINFIILYNH